MHDVRTYWVPANARSAQLRSDSGLFLGFHLFVGFSVPMRKRSPNQLADPRALELRVWVDRCPGHAAATLGSRVLAVSSGGEAVLQGCTLRGTTASFRGQCVPTAEGSPPAGKACLCCPALGVAGLLETEEPRTAAQVTEE